MIHEDQIIRSRRRSIALEIEKDGRLTIRAPYRTSLAEIDAFVISKQKWIAEKQAAAKKRALNTPAPTWTEGSFMPFLGHQIKICYHDRDNIIAKGISVTSEEDRHPAEFDIRADQCIFLPHPRLREKAFKLSYNPDPEKEIRQNMLMVREWYKQVALPVLKKRTMYFEEISGLRCHSVKMSSAKRKWGSCSSKKEILYSWPLICLSFYEADYVIVHELTHTIHMDHSRQFYADLSRILPDYKDREASLHEHNGILTLI
ncbi:MAG: M48 family metallopeptidase [Lachnospiraceae bacterium]|nr:M48 family metallopeptidase [Lachnospiraceae bacterium]